MCIRDRDTSLYPIGFQTRNKGEIFMIAEIPVIALLVLFALIVVLLLAAESKRRQGIDDEDQA